MSETRCSSLLQLLQFSDSALPIGSLSHSFGLETLVYDSDIASDVAACPRSLAAYLEDSFSEWFLVDAVCCREAHACGLKRSSIAELNRWMSALRMARESREASLTMGRRLASLAGAIEVHSAVENLVEMDELHHSAAFGYLFALLDIDPSLTVGAFLHQALLNQISAAQRLLPLGQIQANRLVWRLKNSILNAVEQSRSLTLSSVCSLAHLPDLASMRHPSLPTRLFVS